MNTDLIIGLFLPFAGTSLGAALVSFARNQINGLLQKTLLGFASGVMMAASVWSLLIPSVEMAQEFRQYEREPWKSRNTRVVGHALQYVMIQSQAEYKMWFGANKWGFWQNITSCERGFALYSLLKGERRHAFRTGPGSVAGYAFFLHG